MCVAAVVGNRFALEVFGSGRELWARSAVGGGRERLEAIGSGWEWLGEVGSVVGMAGI